MNKQIVIEKIERCKSSFGLDASINPNYIPHQHVCHYIKSLVRDDGIECEFAVPVHVCFPTHRCRFYYLYDGYEDDEIRRLYELNANDASGC